MPSEKLSDTKMADLKSRLKALGNRYAVQILEVLSPQTGEIIPELGWDEIVDGILVLEGHEISKMREGSERTQEQVIYEEERGRLASGGTLYESMNKLVHIGFVQGLGEKGRKNRSFKITHDGRLALSAIKTMQGLIGGDTEVSKMARLLLRHKNFVSLLPGQEKFLREIGDVEGNLVIQMPPGSGKTFLAMIIILLRLQAGERCVYLTPYTSLNRQIIEEYGELFEHLGYSVVKYDAQSRVTEEDLNRADLVVGIYESVLFSLMHQREWTKGIGLAVIDELTELDSLTKRVQPQNLGTDRSSRLDFLVTLLKERAQTITLSSRFGETEEVLSWLDAEVFRPSFRLRPDEFLVTSGPDGAVVVSSDGVQRCICREKNLIDAVHEHIGDYKKKSMLFVVGTRLGAEELAKWLAKSHPREAHEGVLERVVRPAEVTSLTRSLSETLNCGVAFHHAGLQTSLRGRLEQEIKEGRVRCVVSTTGITAGTSFPFDSVIMVFDGSLQFLGTRSRYLQISGRIGEYHLHRHGGRVYLVFLQPSRRFRTVDDLRERLLHSQLEPLTPNAVDPSSFTNLVSREISEATRFKPDSLKERVLDLLRGSFNAFIDDGYLVKAERDVDGLIKWMKNSQLLESTGQFLKPTQKTRAAIDAGLDIIDYERIRDPLASLKVIEEEDALIDILLEFRLVQSARPRTVMPSDIELYLAELAKPEGWLVELTDGRNMVKKQVLLDWISEMTMAEVIDNAERTAEGLKVGDRPAWGSGLDDGDLVSLVTWSSSIAFTISDYLDRVGSNALAERFEVLGNQLKYGVKQDLGESDLMTLEFRDSTETSSRPISRTEARTLFEHGYQTIERVVKKDIDASKEGLARERFAANCGLEEDLALSIYKSALNRVRERLSG
ncbi:DEAD/DEAH box helicase [Candidatus Thorarchaeota archaeon]|nr:MAG: DEAD/DEAH box helicase [Candidatus Thorarchaeota archaeon]